jgi:UDP-N-acetylglucosamine--N-acetylmuramyl-(pentapeptide) pyrophosphoryl-undecaprenol N-acetylglucosamine transferase
LYYLQKYTIDVVFCKWGYVALPVVFAAASLRIPIVVHESDLHAWLVNKIASKVSKKNFTWFAWVLKNDTMVGQILSWDLLSPVEMDLFTLQEKKKTLLVMCGSQWSEAVFLELLKQLDSDWQVVKNLNIVVILWLLNTSYEKKFSEYLQVTTYDFLDHHQLAPLFARTDIALTRWSATTLAELEYFNIPKVIVPLPSHDQPLNAKWYAQEKWDIVVAQDNISQIQEALQFHLDHPRKKTKKHDMFSAHQQIRESLLS